MPFIPVPNTLQVKLICTWNNQDAVMDQYFTWNTAPGATERSSLATAMHTFWTNHLKTHLPDAVALREIDVVDLSSGSAPTTQLIISPAEIGTHSGLSSPLNAALCVSFRTALRGRNFRGRNYVPGLSQGEIQTAGTWNSTGVSNIINDFAWLLTAANTAAGIWSVISRFFNNSPRATGVSTPITAVTADTNIDSMRRRLIGRGRA